MAARLEASRLQSSWVLAWCIGHKRRIVHTPTVCAGGGGVAGRVHPHLPAAR